MKLSNLLVKATSGLLLAGALFTSSASAATLDIVGGTPGVIPETINGGVQDNQVLIGLGLPNPTSGVFGSEIQLNTPSQTVRIDFFGYEAGNTNSFWFGGTEIFTTIAGDKREVAADVNTPLASIVVNTAFLSGSVLDFSFQSIDRNGNVMTVANGSNPDNVVGSGGVNFFATKEILGGLWLFFDDDGAKDDDNHDDFVVRISAVPLPASALLLLGAFGGLGVMRARKKAA